MTKWQKKTDTMWSLVIRQVGRCEWCGAAGIKGKNGSYRNLDAHHIISRGHTSYRHLVENGVCLCKRCHKFAPHAAHNDRTGFLNWLREKRPGQWKWFQEHTMEITKQIGNEEIIAYKTLDIPHLGDKVEYEMLRDMYGTYEN